MTRPLLLHIGYHKTATTWMQRNLFVPAHGWRQLVDHAEVFAHVVGPHGLAFDPSAMRALIEARRSSVGPDEVPVISSEIMSGNPFFGGRESDVYAERLARIAPDARILISIRNQLRILPSIYMQYILRGGTQTPEGFFAGTEEPGYFGFSSEHLLYDRLVAKYQELFGAGNVYLLPQEALVRDSDAAVRDLAVFCGNTGFTALQPADREASGVSYPEHAVAILRRINHVQASTLNPRPVVQLGRTPKGLYKAAGYLLRRPPLGTVLKKYRPVSDHVRQRFEGFYDESNRRLLAAVVRPLDLTGYPGITAPQPPHNPASSPR